MKLRIRRLLIIPVLIGIQLAAANPAVATQQPEVSIQWLGGPTMLIEFNGMKILTDPMLGEGEKAFKMADPNEMFDLKKGPLTRFHRRLTPRPEVNLEAIDLILLSHAHEDHFDQQAQLELDKSLPLFLPADDLEKVKQVGFTAPTPLQPGDIKTFSLKRGTLRITATPADHTDNKALEPLLGHGLGYFIEFIQGKTQTNVYWTGDSLPTASVIHAVKKIGAVDLLVPNMGRVGTTGPLGKISMGATDVVFLADRLSVKKVLPIHHSSFTLYLEPISELARLSTNQSWGVDIISEGSTLIY